MEIYVYDDIKIVEVWLSRAEGSDAQLHEKLRPLYTEYGSKKYMVAVFHSGKDDLYEQTSHLLLYNRTRAAEQEVKRQEFVM